MYDPEEIRYKDHYEKWSLKLLFHQVLYAFQVVPVKYFKYINKLNLKDETNIQVIPGLYINYTVTLIF